MKADILAKVIIEATILAEKSGLFVNFITTDGASWNRKMWRLMGIRGTAASINCNVQHPYDPTRHLFFNSDFPHLIKCLRNSLLKNGFNTPAGRVTMRPVREAYKIDANNVTFKAMPGITECHLNPNGFEKMRVTYAFQLFGPKVLQAFYLYRNELDKIFGTISATQEFFSKINQLISIMTSRYAAEALRPGSLKTRTLKDFLSYLDQWEKHAKGTGGFLSDSTAPPIDLELNRLNTEFDLFQKRRAGKIWSASVRVVRYAPVNARSIVRCTVFIRAFSRRSGRFVHHTGDAYVTAGNRTCLYNWRLVFGVLYAHDSWQEHPSRVRGYDFVRLSTADANEKSRHPGTHVYTDGYFPSSSAGAAVVVLRPNDSMVAVLKYRLNAASSAYCAEVGVHGNELADLAANAAATSGINREVKSFRVVRRAFHAAVAAECNTRWTHDHRDTELYKWVPVASRVPRFFPHQDHLSHC
ncbi:hypothetical protein HPB49_001780 [Dermacentor silvarum]|uniref:Uncharacterized protein n=1 Tax=Dermacentor silvarum TaxID=543639 RepID=A0ACB8C1F9_DERSI|nr:hypothetical protein HPB49_001780 [Dermacentor silvarum]